MSALDQGDPNAASRLLPLVYVELRTLAAQRMAQEKPGQALQATALVPRRTPETGRVPENGCPLSSAALGCKSSEH